MRSAIVCLASLGLACFALAQPKGAPTTVVGDLKQSYDQIKGLLTRAAADMPESGYGFQPTPEEMTFGKWVAHVADAQGAICGAASGAAKQLGAGSKTTKPDLQAVLKESFAVCDTAYEGTTEANMNDSVSMFGRPAPRLAALYGNIAHDNECYGSMAVYLRLNKLVPPSSQGRGGQGKGKGK